MNLSQLVHENHHTSFHQLPASYHYPQYTAQQYKPNMTSFPSQAANTSYSRSPQLPSPPLEDRSGCTLPSIQNLIGMADGPTTKRGAQSNDAESLQKQQQQHREADHHVDDRSTAYGQASVSTFKAFPPTPPLRPSSGSDGSHQSPSAASSRSSVSMNPYCGSAINNIEPHHQRQVLPTSEPTPYALPRHPSQSPYTNSPYTSSPAMSNYSYPSPVQPVAQTGMYFQRPLPTSYPQSELPGNMAPGMPHMHHASPIDHQNPWQHHHYIPPSPSAAFANQPTDRYICPTCSKAFSRPSSLRIHSHSHTGEKPYKCMHMGCGKAFSVRSNMKRHERGCHGGAGSPGGN